MPATKAKQRKKAPQATKVQESTMPETTALVLAALGGGLLGLSAPGFNLYYLAWFGLAPLLLLVASSKNVWHAALRGLCFGLAYNLVYLNWYWHLQPLDWLGFNEWQGAGISAFAWLFASTHQALVTAIVCLILRALPLTGGFLPRQVDNKWCLPALVTMPLLWVVLQNKVLNAHDWLGVPWTMLEYSQYKQLAVLQVTSIIGGIGLSFLIVLANAVLAQFVATSTGRPSFKSLAAANKSQAAQHVLGVALLVVALIAWGMTRLSSEKTSANIPLAVVQGNINIEMQKTGQRYTLSQLGRHYSRLIEKAPPGLCIFTESALPTYLKEEKPTLDLVTGLAMNGHRDLVIGSIDRDTDGKPFNSAFGVSADGKLSQTVYHKRYLVPFGEYMPEWVKMLPEWVQRLTSTPAGTGFRSGKTPVVLDLSGHSVAPLICFETLSPELVSSSVRNGGQLLVNISDLAWFHDSMIGDQMTAFSVLRAVETGRYFVFAANTGPSVIIDQQGRIKAASKPGQATVLTGKVGMNSERTLFTLWFN